jgi:tight adherence protein B
MRSDLPVVMVGLSFLLLVGFALSGLLVAKAEARRQKRVTRMRDVVAPYHVAAKAGVLAFRPAPRKATLTELLASIFGFHPAKLDQYPLPWWLVLVVALVAGRVAAGVLASFLGTFGFVGWPVVWVLLCRLFFGGVTNRRQALLVSQFPDALAMMVRSVQVGMPVLSAIAAVSREAPAPTSTEFARLVNDISVGVPLDVAVAEMAMRNDIAGYRFFAITIALQAQTGGGLSETLDNLAELIRKRLALKERGHALSSEARTSSMILASLPVLIGLALWALNPSYMSLLFTTSMGQTILGIAVVSLISGGLVMRSIIRRNLS